MIECRTPKTREEMKQYFHFRWQILRKPWQQPEGSEQDELEQQSYHRMFVDEHNNIVAVGRLHLVAQHQAQIRYMAVAENAQGKGYGGKMVRTLEQLAKELGVTELSLNARENALGFYRSLDYQNLGFSHLLYDEINHYKMSKSLIHSCSEKLISNADNKIKLAQQLQQTWHNTIPMSKAMNIEVCFFDGQQLQTSSDLIFNKNLHNTMFAGSIYTLATLTGWGWVYCQLALANLRANIVLAKGEIRYHAPIQGVAIACTSQSLVDGDISALSQTNKARFTIKVELTCGDKLVATFQGSYVAVAEKV